MEENPIHVECLELRNIKYKSMLLNGSNNLKETKSNNMTNLDDFLENEKNNKTNEPWSKLDKTVKTKKLIEYAELYKKTNNLSEEDEKILLDFFKDCLDRKKLQRVKDVVYDKEAGTIKEIPGLTYVKSHKHFTLKNMEKRVATHKCLTPKKLFNGTIKNKED